MSNIYDATVPTVNAPTTSSLQGMTRRVVDLLLWLGEPFGIIENYDELTDKQVGEAVENYQECIDYYHKWYVRERNGRFNLAEPYCEEYEVVDAVVDQKSDGSFTIVEITKPTP